MVAAEQLAGPEVPVTLRPERRDASQQIPPVRRQERFELIEFHRVMILEVQIVVARKPIEAMRSQPSNVILALE
jgi:hypothetical protein